MLCSGSALERMPSPGRAYQSQTSLQPIPATTSQFVFGNRSGQRLLPTLYVKKDGTVIALRDQGGASVKRVDKPEGARDGTEAFAHAGPDGCESHQGPGALSPPQGSPLIPRAAPNTSLH
jgi:hypothetical protein